MSAKSKLIVHSQSAPLQGTISVPGDKSISHRAVLLANHGPVVSGRTLVDAVAAAEELEEAARLMADKKVGADERKSLQAAEARLQSRLKALERSR